ncbi:unnamed protein product [Adineta steineri]|uniref:TIR domain-containing protein n=1 Tax=Adineta steineri TaxID=433720 RepID=A0A819F0Y4_9BILA|nr:unnamed protein product [Adineta steineri]CAF1398896.1 unnamed protein product [Adineta steineri]CAF3803943.1 unnamed protein product [Adineta steineri]CAF3860738.1 unnamed protein product [Adineta steineri]
MANNITNQNNKNLLIFIILTLLIIIWFLSNSTVFFGAVIFVLTTILINPNFETTDNVMTTSSSSQTHTILPSMNNNDDNSTATTVKKSGCELISNNQGETDDEQVAEQSVDHPVSDDAKGDLRRSTAKDEINEKILSANPVDTYQTAPPTSTTTTGTTCSPSPSSPSPVTVLPIKRIPVCVTEAPMKIAISYSSAHRERVYKITDMVKENVKTLECPYPVFIDREFQHEICRPNGRQYFCTIYKQAHLVVVFLSSSYTKSVHCMAEWEEIFSRFYPVGMKSDPLQLLFIKVDKYDMEKLGLKDSDYPLDAIQQKNDEVIAEIIRQRWVLVEEKLAQK